MGGKQPGGHFVSEEAGRLACSAQNLSIHMAPRHTHVEPHTDTAVIERQKKITNVAILHTHDSMKLGRKTAKKTRFKDGTWNKLS